MSCLSFDKNQVIQALKEEYACAREEIQYYVKMFNKQDSLYNVFFVVFSLVFGALYHVSSSGNIVALNERQQVIFGLLVCALAVIYTYFYVIIQANSYYLIIYSEKIIVLEKCLNYYLGKTVYIWETEFMSQIQSKSHVWTKGCINVNYIKTALAFLQYFIIHIGLGVMWFEINASVYMRIAYVAIVSIVSLFIAYNWIKMWFVLPSHYRNELKSIYEQKLEIEL